MTRILILLTILFSVLSEAEAQFPTDLETSPLQTETDSYGGWGTLPANHLFQRVENSRLPVAEEQVSYFEVYELNNQILSTLLRDKSEHIVISLDFEGQSNRLLLTRHELLKDDSRIVDQDYNDLNIEMNALFYRGTIQGSQNSFVVASIFEDEVRIVFSDTSGNVRYSQTNAQLYVAHRDSDILNVPEFSCGIDDVDDPDREEIIDNSGNSRSSSSNTSCQYVEIFFECDYHFFNQMNQNDIAVSQKVYSIFHEVQTIYFNEYIPLIISDIKIWDETDPYSNVNVCSDEEEGISFGLLEAFMEYMDNNYSGRLAHLLTTKPISGCGGQAEIDVICSTNNQFGFSKINTQAVPSFPEYSWNVYVVAHELGHNFGSRHTHWCGWVGGALDDCSTTEGSCSPGPSPTNGGTIMSYCSPNINFNLGFGTQPGNKIRLEYATATCYSNCNTWVDYNYFGTSLGTFEQPFPTLNQAVLVVSDGGTIYIKSSSDDETIDIDGDNSFLIRTWNGPSTIGQ